jgi:hypothetical protein
MPIPNTGYWVDRRSIDFANEIFRCPRETCDPKHKGASSSSIRRHRRLGENCWDMTLAYGDLGDGVCNSDELMCMAGSGGPLCGSCTDGFVYSSAGRVCAECDTQRRAVVLGGCGGIGIVAIAVYAGARHFRRGKLLKWVAGSWVLGIAKQVDSSALRVAWSNYQVKSLTFMSESSQSLGISPILPFRSLLDHLKRDLES